LQSRIENEVLVAEVIVDHAHSDTRLRRDIAKGGSQIAVLRKKHFAGI